MVQHYNLDNLVVIVDRNRIQQGDFTEKTIRMDPLAPKASHLGRRTRQDRTLPMKLCGAEIEPDQASRRQTGPTGFNNMAEDKGLASHGGVLAYPPSNLS